MVSNIKASHTGSMRSFLFYYWMIMKPITVLSLFDWISCGMVALERSWIPVVRYIASEIDIYAYKISKKNYPYIFHAGWVEDLSYYNWYLSYWFELWEEIFVWDIDLLIWGSPCQGFSNAGKGLNFSDPRSKLFFEFVRMLNGVKPKYFLLENVKMKKEWQNIISDHLFGIQPIEINSSLVSAQNRKRLYWVGKRNEDWSYSQVLINQPEDKGILLKDILQDKVDEKYMLSEKSVNGFLNKASIFRNRFKITSPDERGACLTTNNQGSCITQSYILCNINPSWNGQNWNVYSSDGKSPTLTTNKGEWPKILQLPRGANKWGIFDGKTPTLSSNSRSYNNLLHDGYCLRILTPVECERLQTLPDNYTEWVSNTQRYKMLGNGWTVDVIANIFKQIFNS